MYDELLKQLTQLNHLGEVTINFASGIARNTATKEIISPKPQNPIFLKIIFIIIYYL